MSDDIDDDDLDLVESEDGGAPAVPAKLERRELTADELNVLDLAVIVALDMVPRDERRKMGEELVEVGRRIKGDRHVILIRSVLTVARLWATGEEGTRELVGLRNAIAGHFRSRYARRNREAT